MTMMSNQDFEDQEEDEIDRDVRATTSEARTRNVNSRWWDEDTAPEFEGLPDHIARALMGSGFTTAQQVREAGPDHIRGLPRVGKHAFQVIKEWLRGLEQEDDGTR
jgi:hypothetical protein